MSIDAQPENNELLIPSVPKPIHMGLLEYVFLLVAGLALLVLGLPQLLYPLWFDQGAFAACAQTLLRGGALYRDCWEVRGPLVPLLYALPMGLAPQAGWTLAIHVFDLASAAVTAILIGLIARDWFDSDRDENRSVYISNDASFAPFVAGGLYWLMYATLNYWSTAQAEGFANLLLVGGLWLGGRMTKTAPSKATYVWAGVCCGLGVWLKYPFAAFGLVFGLILLFSLRWRGLWSFCTGVVLAMGLGLAYLWLSGAWSDWLLHLNYDWATFHAIPIEERQTWLRTTFWQEIIAFVQKGSTPTAGYKDTLEQVEWLGRGYPLIFALAVLSLRKLFTRSRAGRGVFLALLYFAVAVFVNIWQGHSYRYHFIVALPALALLAGGALKSERTFMQFVTAILSIGAFAGLIAAQWPWVRDAYDNAIGQRKSAQQVYLESKEADYSRLATFIAENTRPDDSIIVFSDVPAIYPLANRPNGTRFPYLRWFDEGRSALALEYYEQRFMDDMHFSQPKLFILTKDNYPWPEARFGETLKRMSAVNTYVQSRYDYVTDIGPFVVFMRREL